MGFQILGAPSGVLTTCSRARRKIAARVVAHEFAHAPPQFAPAVPADMGSHQHVGEIPEGLSVGMVLRRVEPCPHDAAFRQGAGESRFSTTLPRRCLRRSPCLSSARFFPRFKIL